jgi:predicted nucleotide-binding protein
MAERTKVFVSSTEVGKESALALERALEASVEVVGWSGAIHSLGGAVIDRIAAAIKTCSITVVFVSWADVNPVSIAAQTNVLLQVGIMIGMSRREDVFVVLPRGRINLKGLSFVRVIEYGAKESARQIAGRILAELEPRGLRYAAREDGKLSGSPKVFISYSHKDGDWLQTLKTFLSHIASNRFSIWDDTQIAPGRTWREEIAREIGNASVAVLLVTQDFMASPFITSEEVPALLHAAAKRGVSIIWIPVKPATIDRTLLSAFQAPINPAKPLEARRGAARGNAWIKIADAISSAALSRSAN